MIGFLAFTLDSYVNHLPLGKSFGTASTTISSRPVILIFDRLFRTFVPMLVQHIYKIRLISEVGAEQLLLDIAAMKDILIEMPTLTNKRGVAPIPNVPR